ncbi:Platelet-derived growth factor receptor alpha-like 1 [Homarus americanus]|uniref:Platelet-derived growth factor receptor alpha-like 1 n=1 Tax=Homarus americanus TaxID=6706 RepID=A0A8J5K9S7_HOMAM|nr:Platelet-derived growth factor receptor alpha-like 1 [Homarus americanus]
MIKCWETEPGDRPSFAEISDQLSDMLTPEIKRRYENLYFYYQNQNKEHFKTQIDYLQMLSSPDCENRLKND